MGQFWEDLRNAAATVEKLKLTKDQISIFFPKDLLEEGLGEEIIIFVEGLFTRPERTVEIRNELARKLGEVAKSYFPKALVECFVRLFNTRFGFWASSRQH